MALEDDIPGMEKDKFYITTSIAYTNAPPHIGYALELVQADVVARYDRLLGKNVLFLTGTDEHGIKIERTAEKAGKTPKEFVDELSGKFRELAENLNISNDAFIRTTDKNHHSVVEKVWNELKEKGDIEKRKYKGFYCVGCEAFLQEKSLVEGKCPIHQREPEAIEEENYFFKLSKYSKQIKEVLEKNLVQIIPEKRKNEILTFVSEGLEDVSFSRPRDKLNWGIPVPRDDSQVIYVWADALVNYISALGYPKGEKFKEFWPADVHFVGKDILRFHSTIWLGMLLSLGLELPKSIFVHGFITSGGQKMSKSLGNVINPFDLVSKYGTDPVRYFLLSELPSTEDGDFSVEKFESRYNSDLAKGIGNLSSRIIQLSKLAGLEPELIKEIKSPELKREVEKARENCKAFLNEFKFNEALGSIWDVIHFCDKLIEKEKPWSFNTAQDKEKSIRVISDLLIVVSELSQLLSVFLPETSLKIEKQIQSKEGTPLFPRIK